MKAKAVRSTALISTCTLMDESCDTQAEIWGVMSGDQSSSLGGMVKSNFLTSATK